ncbi:MAG: DUF4387 domain-containing protein [Propionibacteriaceae bacterium]|nr:DUF4387 domain-containing protein [Propionibacteriaceae bacterium]
MTKKRLADVATQIRAKNAGPFWLTLDVFLPDAAAFAELLGKALTAEKVAALYHVAAADVSIYPMADLNVVKISMPRPFVQGSFEDRDMHSGQQHVPLMGLSWH